MEIIIWIFENTFFLSLILGIIAFVIRCSFPAKKKLTNLNEISREGKNWKMIPNKWNDKQYVIESLIISIVSALFIGIFILPNYISIIFGTWEYVTFLILTLLFSLLFKSVEDLIFYAINSKNKDLDSIKLDMLTIIRNKEDIPDDLKNVLIFIVEHQDDLKNDFTNISKFIRKTVLENLNKTLSETETKVNKIIKE